MSNFNVNLQKLKKPMIYTGQFKNPKNTIGYS